MEDKDKADKGSALAKEQEMLKKIEKELSDRYFKDELEKKKLNYYLNSWYSGGINE